MANPHDHDHRSGLLNNMLAALEHFEVEHPRLTDTLNRIMVSLGV